jgi:hypothetical protein
MVYPRIEIPGQGVHRQLCIDDTATTGLGAWTLGKVVGQALRLPAGICPYSRESNHIAEGMSRITRSYFAEDTKGQGRQEEDSQSKAIGKLEAVNERGGTQIAMGGAGLGNLEEQLEKTANMVEGLTGWEKWLGNNRYRGIVLFPLLGVWERRIWDLGSGEAFENGRDDSRSIGTRLMDSSSKKEER